VDSARPPPTQHPATSSKHLAPLRPIRSLLPKPINLLYEPPQYTILHPPFSPGPAPPRTPLTKRRRVVLSHRRHHVLREGHRRCHADARRPRPLGMYEPLGQDALHAPRLGHPVSVINGGLGDTQKFPRRIPISCFPISVRTRLSLAALHTMCSASRKVAAVTRTSWPSALCHHSFVSVSCRLILSSRALSLFPG